MCSVSPHVCASGGSSVSLYTLASVLPLFLSPYASQVLNTGCIVPPLPSPPVTASGKKKKIQIAWKLLILCLITTLHGLLN